MHEDEVKVSLASLARVVSVGLGVPLVGFLAVRGNSVMTLATHGLQLPRVRRLDESIAPAMMARGGMVVVSDARKDPQLARAGFLQAHPRVRFVAAAPVHAVVGRALLVVGDVRERTLADGEIQLLADAADVASAILAREPPTAGAWTPSPEMLRLLGRKWTVDIVQALATAGASRFRDLMARLGGISSRTLAARLDELERHGMIERRQFGEMPVRVEYRVTPLGSSLLGERK